MANVGDEKDGSGKSREEALEDAGRKFGSGRHELKVTDDKVVVVNSPGQVTEYRVKVRKTG